MKWIFIAAPETPFISTQLFIKGMGVEADKKLYKSLNDQGYTGIESDENTVSVSKDLKLPIADSIAAFCINKKHLKLESVRFYDVTD